MARPSYRAVSLDLWFTAVYYTSDLENLFEEDRIRTLGEILRSDSGGRIGRATIASAMETVHHRLRERGLNTGTVDPQNLVEEYAQTLGAHLSLPPEEAGQLYSDAGLALHPPTINQELVEVVGAFEARGIPILAITNTARRGGSWLGFFRSRGITQFQHVVASCEVGRAKPDPEIFHEAVRRMGLEPGDLLHVGDRWELDVEGARRAGCGAALYRGLWPYYPPGMYSETDAKLLEKSDVIVLDRLGDLVRVAGFGQHCP